MQTEPIRIPLREAGGVYSSTARYSGDTASRIGRHKSTGKDNAARTLRKKQRREWKRVENDVAQD